MYGTRLPKNMVFVTNTVRRKKGMHTMHTTTRVVLYELVCILLVVVVYTMHTTSAGNMNSTVC